MTEDGYQPPELPATIESTISASDPLYGWGYGNVAEETEAVT